MLLAYIIYQNIQSQREKTYAHFGRLELNTQFYTDDVLSSLNYILQIYTRVKKNAKK